MSYAFGQKRSQCFLIEPPSAPFPIKYFKHASRKVASSSAARDSYKKTKVMVKPATTKFYPNVSYIYERLIQLTVMPRVLKITGAHSAHRLKHDNLGPNCARYFT